MNSIKTCFYWGGRLAIADAGFRIAILSVAVLSVLALLPGLHQLEIRKARCQELENRNQTTLAVLEAAFEDDDQLEELLDRQPFTLGIDQAQDLQFAAQSPDMLAHLEGVWWTWNPPSSLAAVAIGESTLWPDRYRIESLSRSETLRRNILLNPEHLSVGPFDLMLFVAAVVPLVMIFLTYDLISSDREQGILSLILSQPVSYPLFIFVQCLIRAAGITLVITTVCLLMLVITNASLMTSETLFQFFIWSTVLFFYAMLWGMLGVVVNTLGFSSMANLILLLFLWVVMALITPVGIEEWVTKKIPLLPETYLAERESQILKESEENLDEILAKRIQHPPYLSSEERSFQQMRTIEYLVMNDETVERFQQDLNAYYQRYLDREEMLSRLSWASPVVAWRRSALRLAETDVENAIRFARQTADFQTQYVDYFGPLSIEGEEMTRERIQQIPQFDTNDGLDGDAKPSGLRIGQLGLVLPLLVWNIILILIACLRLRHRIAVK